MTISRQTSQTNSLSEIGFIGLEHFGHVMPAQCRRHGLVPDLKEKCMKAPVVIVAFFLLCGHAFAQDTGPAPQSGMDKPGMTTGAKPNGAMDTTGMSTAQGNLKRKTDGAPAADRRKDRH